MPWLPNILLASQGEGKISHPVLVAEPEMPVFELGNCLDIT